MAKVSALFNLGAALEATIEIGRRAAAGDPVAVSGLPTMTLSPATRENLTTYLKNPEALDRRQRNVLEKYLIRSSQEGSSWGSRERMRQSGATEYAGEAQERRIITPEDLYNERANLAPVMGDKSVTGREIVSVQGVPLSKSVMGDGGPGYAQAWEDFNVAWASMEGAAKAKQAHFDKIARDTNGKAPVGVYMAMTDVAMDFNTMTSEGLIRQFKNLDVSKSDKKAFDEAVRESIPEWVGIDSPDAIDQIYGNVPLTSANKKGDALPSSALRKRLVFEFGKKKWQDKGFPVYDDVIVAFTEPALLDAKLGDSGFTMFDTIPGADVVPVVGHNTYDTSIMGKYKGGFEQSVPTEIMFPKLWADLEGQMTVPKEGSRSAPRLLNRQEKIGAIRLGHGYQPADQAWLDGISSWLEKNKGTASSALLATLVSAGIITPQDAEAGVITGFAKGGQKAADMMLQNVVDEAARLTKQGFPEDTAMRIATGELPMDTASRNARAVEQGYDPFETWYHGTADDITAFDPAKSQSRDFGHAGKGTYVASHPGIARAYANTAAGSADANIMPLRTSANNPLRISLEEKQALGQAGPSATARLQQQAISEGFDSVEVIMPNGEILERVIFDPANIRSINAAFDPANKGKSALLGGLGGAAVVGGSMTPEEAQAGPLNPRQNMLRLQQAAKEKAGVGSTAKNKGAYASWDIGNDSYEKYNPATGEMDEVALPDYALIEKLYVPPEQRGTAKGRQLVVDAVDEIRAEHGDIDIRLTADPFGEGKMDTKDLVKYYEDMGFELDGGSDTSMTLKNPTQLNKYRAAGAVGAAGAAGTAGASDGGMGVRMPPTAEDEEAMLAPTGGDLMQQANRDFASSIRTQPEPDFLTSVQQQLLSGIMKTAGVADLSADVVSAMAGPLLSAPGAIARYAADRYVPGVNYTAEEMAQGRRETEDYFNYQPRTEQGPQYGEQIMQGIGGAIAPYVPAIKKAAGDSYILGAMRQGYDYLGEREKELAKALMDLSPI
jgi:hypothetical protein